MAMKLCRDHLVFLSSPMHVELKVWTAGVPFHHECAGKQLSCATAVGTFLWLLELKRCLAGSVRLALVLHIKVRRRPRPSD